MGDSEESADDGEQEDTSCTRCDGALIFLGKKS